MPIKTDGRHFRQKREKGIEREGAGGGLPQEINNQIEPSFKRNISIPTSGRRALPVIRKGIQVSSKS